METCRIYTEAKDRNCSRAPIQNVRYAPRPYPTPPPFSPHPDENKNVRGKTPRFTSRNKGLTCFHFLAYVN